MNLPVKCSISTQEELLTSLPLSIESPRNLSPSERPIREESAILSGEWNSLRDTLVDDVYAELCEPIHVSLTRAKVAPFNGVVKETVRTISIILIIFCGVDASLRSDAVSPARRILEAKALHLIAELPERGGC
jgi:hypothetical protein